MKRYIILFAIFITAVFFYPVFAYADLINNFWVNNPLSAPVTLLIMGSGLLVTASVTRRLAK